MIPYFLNEDGASYTNPTLKSKENITKINEDNNMHNFGSSVIMLVGLGKEPTV